MSADTHRPEDPHPGELTPPAPRDGNAGRADLGPDLQPSAEDRTWIAGLRSAYRSGPAQPESAPGAELAPWLVQARRHYRQGPVANAELQAEFEQRLRRQRKARPIRRIAPWLLAASAAAAAVVVSFWHPFGGGDGPAANHNNPVASHSPEQSAHLASPVGPDTEFLPEIEAPAPTAQRGPGSTTHSVAPNPDSVPTPDGANLVAAARGPSAFSAGDVRSRDDGLEFRRPNVRIVLLQTPPDTASNLR
jgi:hypothetical protein